jgi:hypothetical protein
MSGEHMGLLLDPFTPCIESLCLHMHLNLSPGSVKPSIRMMEAVDRDNWWILCASRPAGSASRGFAKAWFRSSKTVLSEWGGVRSCDLLGLSLL